MINDVSLEEYVTSVISSEMSASCPLELLKAHAVISRSWLWFPKANPSRLREAGRVEALDSHEILRWYGREAHPDFDVCADDHCQRYQGITKAFSPAVAEAVRATAGEFLRYNGAICDARFSKSCGGITERYATAWEDEDIPYLGSVYDGARRRQDACPTTVLRHGYAPTRRLTAIPTIRSSSRAFCRDSIRRLAISIAGGSRTRPKNLPI